MSKRLLLLAAVAGLAVVGAGCADDVSPGLTVGSTTISNDDLLAEVGEWAGNPTAVDPADLAGSAPGTFPQALVGQVIQRRIVTELQCAELDELGVEVTDDDRQAAIAQVLPSPDMVTDVLAGFSDDFAATFARDAGCAVAIQDALGDGFDAWIDEALRTADITVNPRYGSWDAASGTVVPPAGPLDPAVGGFAPVDGA